MTQHTGKSDWQLARLQELQVTLNTLREDLATAIDMQRELHDIAYSVETKLAIQKPLLRQYAQALGSERQAIGTRHKALLRQINGLQASTIFLHDQARHVTAELCEQQSIVNETYNKAADFAAALSDYLREEQARLGAATG